MHVLSGCVLFSAIVSDTIGSNVGIKPYQHTLSFRPYFGSHWKRRFLRYDEQLLARPDGAIGHWNVSRASVRSALSIAATIHARPPQSHQQCRGQLLYSRRPVRRCILHVPTQYSQLSGQEARNGSEHWSEKERALQASVCGAGEQRVCPRHGHNGQERRLSCLICSPRFAASSAVQHRTSGRVQVDRAGAYMLIARHRYR